MRKKREEAKYQNAVNRRMEHILHLHHTATGRPRKVFTSVEEARKQAGVRLNDDRFDNRLNKFVRAGK
jgi:hypothetical protein